jgi:peptide/nickel transport system permease protein
MMIFRLSQSLITLVIVSFVIFWLGRMSGNPADLILGARSTPAERAALTEQLGLDKPIIEQYLHYAWAALHGNFGTSLRSGMPAADLVVARLPITLALATAATVVAVAASVPLGIASAVKKDRFWDRFSLVVSLFSQSVPTFWLGVGCVVVFSVWLRWLPSSGSTSWAHWVMPVGVMGAGIWAGIIRLTRSNMLDALDSDYVKLARIKGASEARVLFRHALPNALIPVVTYIGLMYGVLISSSVVVEVVFGWPGLGSLAYEATLWRDFPVLQLVVLVYTAIVLAATLLVDMAYGFIDPRVRAA